MGRTAAGGAGAITRLATLQSDSKHATYPNKRVINLTTEYKNPTTLNLTKIIKRTFLWEDNKYLWDLSRQGSKFDSIESSEGKQKARGKNNTPITDDIEIYRRLDRFFFTWIGQFVNEVLIRGFEYKDRN